MIDDDLKIAALACIGVMMVITVYPVLSMNRIVEPFSELGILGPNGKLGDYPREVNVGEKFNLFIYVGNSEGRVEYYRVYAKLGSKAQNVSDSTPFDAPVLASYDLVLMNNQNQTTPVAMSIPQPGINLRLVFELHMFDVDSGQFVYHNRWTQLWLNVTKTN